MFAWKRRKAVKEGEKTKSCFWLRLRLTANQALPSCMSAVHLPLHPFVTCEKTLRLSAMQTQRGLGALKLHLRHKGLKCKNASIRTEPVDISSKHGRLEFVL